MNIEVMMQAIREMVLGWDIAPSYSHSIATVLPLAEQQFIIAPKERYVTVTIHDKWTVFQRDYDYR